MNRLHIAVRVSPDVVKRLDAMIPSLSTSWRKATRSDAVRAAIVAGLDVIAPTPTKPRKRGTR